MHFFLSKQLAIFLLFCSFACSIGFYQMAKIAVTPTIVLAEFVLFRKAISHKKVSITFLCKLFPRRDITCQETYSSSNFNNASKLAGFVSSYCFSGCGNCNSNRFTIQLLWCLHCNCMDHSKCYKQNSLVESATTSQLDCSFVSTQVAIYMKVILNSKTRFVLML